MHEIINVERSGRRVPSCRMQTSSARAAALLTLILIGSAAGQTPFVAPQFWTVGLQADGVHVFVDTDGDIQAEQYTLPTQLQHQVDLEYRLSPNIQILYIRAFGAALAPSCTANNSPSQIYYFRLVKDTATTGHLVTILNGSLCINGPVPDHEGLYEVAGQAQHVAFIVEARDTPAATTQRVHWINLNGVNERGTTIMNIDVDIPFMFEPSGLAALFAHHVGGGNSIADVMLVDLCEAPRLGDNLSGGVLNGLDFSHGQPTAESVIVGGALTARVHHPDLTAGMRDFPLTPCGPAPVMGACCSSGSCTQTLEADCTGTWSANTPCSPNPCTGACCLPCPGSCEIRTQAACMATPGAFWLPGLTCSSCFSAPVMQVTKTGPAGPVLAGTPFSYTLTYSNVGHGNAAGVQVLDVLPTTLAFVSAGPGGTFNGSTRTVTWTVGSVAACSSGQVTLTVSAVCGASSVTNSNYSVRLGTGVSWSGSPPVTTQVTQPGAQPINVAVTSIPSRTPLQRGDTITHTISLVNTAAESRDGINFNVSFGSVSMLDAVVDAAGGTATTNATSMSWTGTLAASAAANIVFRTRINDCVPASVTSERLNFGNAIDVRNACSIVVGSGTPPSAIAFQHAVVAAMLALPPVGPPQSGRQLVRPGDTIDLQLTVSNVLPADQPSVSGSIVLPATLTPVGNPPFIAPTDSAAAYDSATRTISWSGPIAANSSIVITFRVTVLATACGSGASWNGNTGACNDHRASASLLSIPIPPAEPYLLGINIGGPNGRIWTYRPGIDSAPQTVLCYPDETNFGMGRGPGGDIWVVGVPVLRLNPLTLEFEVYPAEFVVSTLGITPFGLAWDVAVDPRDNTAVFVGYNQGIGLGHAKVVRYNHVTGQASMILDGASTTPVLRSPRRVVIEPDGHIGMTADAGGSSAVVRIDPANPTAFQVFPIPETAVSLALDTDGDYLVTGYEFGGSSPRPLNKVNRVTGAVTQVIPNLKTLVPSQQTWYGMAVATDGRLFLSVDSVFGGGVSGIVDRGPPATGQAISLADAPDIAFVAGSNASRGDMNCDAAKDGLDVQAFTLALIDSAQYAAQYPSCNILNGDFTGDGMTTPADTAGFVQCLLSGVCP